MSNNTVCFYNGGKFDKRSFTMLGLSAKTDDDAIGFFGTGFKYAIATLLRNGCNVSMRVRDDDSYHGHTVYDFYSRRDTFRNKEFDFIYCRVDDGTDCEHIELPYTTHLGTNWKLWQAFRELYTNALDENGGVCEDEGSIHDDVRVLVKSDEFFEVFQQRAKYFIDNDKYKTLARTVRMRCINKMIDGDNVVYYKSMYTGTRLEKESLFTYDYTHRVDLTEDRTIADTWHLKHHITDVWILGMSYDMLIEYLPKIANKLDLYEHDLSSYNSPGEKFLEAVAYLIKHRRSVPIWAHEMYIKSRPFDEQVTHHKPTKHQKKMIDCAMRILEHSEIMVDADKVIICSSLPDEMMGMYRNGTIYLSKRIFERGDMALLGTLYEEWVHMYHGVDDMTRRMQNILVDKIAYLMAQAYDGVVRKAEGE